MQWFLRKSDRESGLFSFQDLVQKVRDGELAPDDMIRPDYLLEWQRADSVIGLFHMAARDDLPRSFEGPSQAELEAYALENDPDLIDFCDDEPEDESLETEALPRPSQRPRWVQRLIDIRGKRTEESSSLAATANATDPDFQGYSKSLWSQIIGSATDKVDSSLNPQRGLLSRIGALTGSCFSPTMLRIGFRLIVAFVCANLASYWVINWTDTEALRFPSRDPQAAAKQVFPLLGECTSFEYSMYLFDFMLVVGVLAFFAAHWIESYADD